MIAALLALVGLLHQRHNQKRHGAWAHRGGYLAAKKLKLRNSIARQKKRNAAARARK